MNILEDFSKRIQELHKTAASMTRSAQQFARLRDDLVAGVERLRIMHPALVRSHEDGEREAPQEEDVWASSSAEALLQAVRDYHARTKRFPSSTKELKPDAVVAAFLDAHPTALTVAKDIVRKQLPRKRPPGGPTCLPPSRALRTAEAVASSVARQTPNPLMEKMFAR